MVERVRMGFPQPQHRVAKFACKAIHIDPKATPSKRVSGNFLHHAHQRTDAPYRRRPIKEIGRCLHNESIDNTQRTELNRGETR